MLALTLIQLCARDYQDIAYERIARDQASATTSNMADWLSWLNDAARTIVALRPDANATIEATLLAASTTKQSVPSGCQRLLGVTRNMGANGTTVGKAIRFSTDREVLDELNRDWHSATPASPVREVIYDEKKDPLHYWVTPPAISTAWYIELITSKIPTDVAAADAASGSFQLSDVYGAAAQAWMLYRAYSMQSQSAALMQRALGHFQEFFNLLGVKLRGEMWTGPKTPEGFPMVPTQASNGRA